MELSHSFLTYHFKVSSVQEHLFANVDFRLLDTYPWFLVTGLPHFLFFSDLSYNELEQLPPKVFYGMYWLEEL